MLIGYVINDLANYSFAIYQVTSRNNKENFVFSSIAVAVWFYYAMNIFEHLISISNLEISRSINKKGFVCFVRNY